ncbi:related to NUDIX family hydrolase [Ramularia collo-cygni]|uniref:Related to NUDIX family hydrolase n=1 Tax=Ramularia collo-cygni TaxID=112498 RepID=A0A2D3V5Y5_9PEZI|nr:related to NUDIX family hydrolase [Ramularia collo-cygni]CZT22115.1 related to NUDIX family hydrolase [Ramularia collo-cygni]
MLLNNSIPRTAKPLLSQILRLPPALRTLTTTPSIVQQQDNSSALHEEELRRQTMSNKGYSDKGYSESKGPKKEKKAPAIPRPSASVLVISPQNQILLLQRVKQSSSFPSAHVFPGGNVSEFHDGRAPDPESPERHVDSEVYRMAAVRETFEESGILLARNNGFGRLIELDEKESEEGRKAVHGNKVPFQQWLSKKGGRADLDGLVPFTRWITPTNVPKRFTTQMYIYFLPTSSDTPLQGGSEDEVKIPTPTTDGGLEHTTARFLPASAWCRLAQEGRVILFPPQFFLLHQIAQHFDDLAAPTDYASIKKESLSREELERRRKSLMEFVKGGTPPWTEKCISPIVSPQRDGKRREDGRSILGLNRPGPELEAQNAGRAGLQEECVLVEFQKDGPRRLAVISREEAIGGGAKL